jgi:cobalt/nickel transport system ATP-binding protein
MNCFVEIRNLRFTYPQGKKVLEGLDFNLKRGERVGLIGPNGAGKTTLFRLLVGLLRPEAGEIRVLGKPRKREEDFLEVRRKVGLLFQDPEDQLFYPTVEEDIAFGPLNLGRSHEEAREIVRECTEMLGISELRAQATNRLSDGEKRLAALTSVVAMKPECFLLDEPTAGLDGLHTERLLNYLREHAETYIISSHDTGFIREAAERLCVLEDGKLRESAMP